MLTINEEGSILVQIARLVSPTSQKGPELIQTGVVSCRVVLLIVEGPVLCGGFDVNNQRKGIQIHSNEISVRPTSQQEPELILRGNVACRFVLFVINVPVQALNFRVCCLEVRV